MNLRLLTLAQTAKQLGISPITLKREIERGQFPAVRVGSQWRIPEVGLIELEKKWKAMYERMDGNGNDRAGKREVSQ